MPGEQGTVVLTFAVNTDGSVSDVKVVQPAQSYRLNDAAVAQLLGRFYSPATQNGKPVAVRLASAAVFPEGAAAQMSDASLDATADLQLSCRYGTHHIAVDACTALLVSGKVKPEDVLYPRARAYAELGQTTQAIADYDRLLGLKSNFAEFYRARGLLYEASHQYAHAVEDYGRAVAVADDVVTRFDRGFAYTALGQQAPAATDFAVARAKASQCTVHIAGRGVGADTGPAPIIEGQLMMPVGGTSPDQIATAGTTVSRPCPALTPPSGLAGACTRQFRAGDMADAMTECDSALSRNPRLAPALYVRGLAKARLGDGSGAMADILAARQIDPFVASSTARYGIAP